VCKLGLLILVLLIPHCTSLFAYLFFRFFVGSATHRLHGIFVLFTSDTLREYDTIHTRPF